MLIVRANPKGGHPLKQNHFPLHQDQQGNFGFLIGYNKDGDKILIPISLAEQIGNQLGSGATGLTAMINKFTPRRSFKEWLFVQLFGKKEYRELSEQYEDQE